MAGQHWREAATLILVGRACQLANGPKLQNNLQNIIKKENYNILSLKRSSKSPNMPEFVAFPGGTIDDTDLNPKWLTIFEQNGYTKQDLIKLFRFPGGRPEMYSNKSSENIIPELAFRICAMRETFEETGLLLASKSGFSSVFPLEKEESSMWRRRVHKDPLEFMKLLQHINKIPSVINFQEWCSWLSPTIYQGYKRRFDTIFYTAFIDSEIPVYEHNKHEVEELMIAGTSEYLNSYFEEKKIDFMPPQLYEFLRFANFSDFDKFKQFSDERSCKGIMQTFPVFFSCKNGKIAALLGDDLYPDNPDYYNHNEINIESTIEEARQSSHHLHRTEFYKSGRKDVIVQNIKVENGHCLPKLWKDIK